MENKPRYKLVKRKTNNDTKNQNEPTNPNIPELITSIKRSLYGDIDARAKYWMEQRMGLLLNNNALMQKNTTELKIDYDNNSGGLSWLFKYNGSTVAYIDNHGFLYCSNILLNGVNLLNAVNNIVSINQNLNDKSDVGHTHTTADITDMGELITTKKLNTNNISLTSSDNNTWVPAMEMFAPNLTNGNHVICNLGKKFGKGTSGHIGYKYSTKESECGLVFGLHSYGDIVTITNDKLISTVPINVNTNKDGAPVEVRYRGTLGKNKYIRYMIGDNVGQSVFAYGHDDKNTPYLYIKLYGKFATIYMYSNSIGFNCRTTCDDVLIAKNIAEDNETRLAAVESTLTNKSDVGHTHSINDITDLNNGLIININDATNPALRLLNSNTGSVSMYIGKELTNGNCGIIQWNHSTDGNGDSKNYLGIMMYGGLLDLIKFYFNEVEIIGLLTVMGDVSIRGNETIDGNEEIKGDASVYGDATITGTTTMNGKLETTKTTPTDAFGENFQNMIFQLIYPIGSIYISYDKTGFYMYEDRVIRLNKFGCVFELLPSGMFLRNQAYSIVEEIDTGVVRFTEYDTIGWTGGEAYHTLTVDEMPSHSHTTGHYGWHWTSNDHNVQCVSHDPVWGDGLQTAGFYCSNTGGGQAHNNLPPFKTVYMWQRVA